MRHPSRSSRVLLAAGAAVLPLAAPVPSASADGLPVLGVDVGAQGVTVPASPTRLVALPVRGGTLVAAIDRTGGAVRRLRTLPRRLTIPAVAYDASAGGLSADGRTLVLIRPRRTFPQRRTTLAIADARRLTIRRLVRLRGDFSFDAVSPDGRTVFVIHYTSRRDPTRYEVRAMDAATGGLRPRPIIDPAEPDEAMRGAPLSRAMSPDGRFAYTLYDGAGGEPFVHALDTRRATARCFVLPALGGRGDVGVLRLGLTRDGRVLRVLAGAASVLALDTARWTAVRPVEAAASAPRPRRPAAAPGGDGSGPAWPLVAAVLAGVAVLALVARAVRPGSARGPARLRAR